MRNLFKNKKSLVTGICLFVFVLLAVYFVVVINKQDSIMISIDNKSDLMYNINNELVYKDMGNGYSIQYYSDKTPLYYDKLFKSFYINDDGIKVYVVNSFIWDNYFY